MVENYYDILNFLDNTDLIYTKDVNSYKNKSSNKCINEFEILYPISRGLVWKVKKAIRYYENDNDQIKKDYYAIKKTHINTQRKRRYYSDGEMINYFLKIINEIKICSILKHQNIIKVHEIIYNISHPYLYMVTDYCDISALMILNDIESKFKYYHNYDLIIHMNLIFDIEIDLKDGLIEYENMLLLKPGFLSFTLKKKLAKFLFLQIFKAVEYMHSHSISHRDLKPNNIVFDTVTNQSKIIDFSISTYGKNYTNEPGGSIHFQAPEQFENNCYNPYLSDLWSLGVCFYIFIFEKYPFDRDNEIELQINIINNELDFPDYTDIDTVDFLKKLINKNYDQRYIYYNYFN